MAARRPTTPQFADSVRAFDTDGFAILPGVVSEAELAGFRTLTESLIARAGGNAHDIFTNYYLPHRPDQGALYDLAQRVPEFDALARLPVVVAFLREAYARNFFLYENSVVYKPRGAANEVPWHQDFMSRRNEPNKVIMWLALDDVDEENGCIYVLAGSHSQGYRPRFKVRGQTHHTRARIDSVEERGKRAVTMRAGDVLLFQNTLLHSSERVASVRPRRAYRAAYMSFDASIVPRGSPLVISLDDPSELDRRFVYEPNLLKKVVHRVGKLMLRF